MSKVKTGESDPTMPRDDKIEKHSVTVAGNSTKQIDYDFNYNNEPLVALGSTTTSVNYTSKGSSTVTVENQADSEEDIEVIVVGN